MPLVGGPVRRGRILIWLGVLIGSSWSAGAALACTDDVSIVQDREGFVSMPAGEAGQFTQADYEAAIQFDLAGEHGEFFSDPARPTAGYPCGVPNSYTWKRGTEGEGRTDVRGLVQGQSAPREAGSAYAQVYNACRETRPSVPNARIELTNIIVDFYSVSQKRWIRMLEEQVGGTAFAEDFLNNEATSADVRSEAGAHQSVRSGINNAAPRIAGAPGGRVADGRMSFPDGPVGYNFFGSTKRFAIAWSDVEAVIVTQAMRCIPESGTDLEDCNKFGYIANLGLNYWATTTSPFDGFQTHGGVAASRFKVVSTDWQIFANYSGPKEFAGIVPPQVPRF